MDAAEPPPGVALVTGASRGIGAATAVALAVAGWDVAISYRERAEAAAVVVAEVEKVGRRAVARRADLAVVDDIVGLFGGLDDAFGRLDLLVNNAGIVSPAGRVAEYTAERLDAVLRLNVTGAFLAAGEAVRRMSTSRGGRGGVIVNVSSRAAVLGSAGEYVDYAASKAALDVLTVGLANEVAAEGIRVVGVRPGLIGTDIHEPGRLERLARRSRWAGPGGPRRWRRRSSGWRRRPPRSSPAPRSTSAAAADFGGSRDPRAFGQMPRPPVLRPVRTVLLRVS